MIDLEKIITWFCIWAAVGLGMFLSHHMTMSAVRNELANIVIPMHGPQPDPRLPLSANPSLDSIAWCLTYIELERN